MNDKDGTTGYRQSKCVLAKSPYQLPTLGWTSFVSPLVAVLISLGWTAWAIVATIVVVAGGIYWIRRKRDSLRGIA